MKQIVNQSRVKVKCPVYKNGKTFFGTVQGIKAQCTTHTTYYVLIDGKKKGKSFASVWLTTIN